FSSLPTPSLESTLVYRTAEAKSWFPGSSHVSTVLETMDMALMDQLIREHTYGGLFFSGADERESDSESEREEEEEDSNDDDDASGSEVEEEEEEEEAPSSEPSSPVGHDAKRSSGGVGRDSEGEEEEKGGSAAGERGDGSGRRLNGKGKKRGEG
ncbi:unnamed protein product, partial [Ectocarpus sp. 13 AM-2016]